MKNLVSVVLAVFLQIAFLSPLATEVLAVQDSIGQTVVDSVGTLQEGVAPEGRVRPNTSILTPDPGVTNVRSVLPEAEMHSGISDDLLAASVSQEPEEQINALVNLVRYYLNVDVDSAHLHLNRLMDVLMLQSEVTRDKDIYPVLFDVAGKIELGFEKRNQVLERIVSYTRLREDDYELMHAYRRLSLINYHVSRLDKALEYQLESRRISMRPGMPAYARIFPYVYLAHIYKDRLEGVQYADSVLAMVAQSDELPVRALYWIHTRLGTFFESVQMPGDALDNFEIAHVMLKNNKSLEPDPAMFLGLGKVYFALGNDERAEAYLQRAQLESELTTDLIPEIPMEIAEAMIRLGEKTNQTELVESYALKVVEMGRYADYLRQLILAHRTLYKMYLVGGQEAKADFHLGQYFEVRDALDEREKNNETYLDLRALEIARKQIRFSAVEARLQMQSDIIVRNRVILGCLLVICLVLGYFWKKQKTLFNALASKNEQIKAYLGALENINGQLVEARIRAEESDRFKTAILQNMSHEIRTPLTSILGFAEMIEEGGQHLEIASQIQRGGRRLMQTLTSVMDLAQLESGVAMLNCRPFDMRALLQKTVARLNALVEEKDLDLDLVLPEDTPVQVLADPSAIERIASNIVHNAIHFTRVGAIRIELRRMGKNAILRVTDTGIGIAPEFLADAFSPFRQESEGHGRTHEGVGLGLAIARHLVELMEGRISVSSTKGEGSEFTVILPIAIASTSNSSA